MFTIASSTALWNSFSSDTGTLLFLGVTTVLVALASLLGLGFAVRHAKKYITGKKF